MEGKMRERNKSRSTGQDKRLKKNDNKNENLEEKNRKNKEVNIL
ncbi:37674_t:CDS:2, partial [Gigaspora margarita]